MKKMLFYTSQEECVKAKKKMGETGIIDRAILLQTPQYTHASLKCKSGGIERDIDKFCRCFSRVSAGMPYIRDIMRLNLLEGNQADSWHTEGGGAGYTIAETADGFCAIDLICTGTLDNFYRILPEDDECN